MTIDERWSRFQNLYVKITGTKIGDYRYECELEIAEYLELRKEFCGY